LLALYGDPAVMRHWSHPAWTSPEQAHAAIAEAESDRALGRALHLAMIDRVDALLAGSCALFDIHPQHRRATLGYLLARPFWGQGLAGEGVAALIAHGFGALGLVRIEAEIAYPMVVKIPDDAFSRGVVKVREAAEFVRVAGELLQQSALILIQEYMYTEFDWRIGVLNRQPIFARKYFMSKGHWQVAERDANGKAEFGMAVGVPLGEMPPDLLAHALHAANLIGDGLYGVDMKVTSLGPVVIEVNDNPNIDAGAEDSVLGDALYRIVLCEFVRRLDLLHRGAQAA
jgi:hypothetical protein